MTEFTETDYRVTSKPGRGTRAKRVAAMDVHIGARVRAGRQLRAFTQKMLSDAMGLSKGQIDKYERGDNAITGSRLHEIGRVLNIAPEWFFAEFAPDKGVPFERPEISHPERVAAMALADDLLALDAAQRKIVRDLVQQLKQATTASGDAAAA
jgi:transcriptional regulator with XRE-family HTH domain